MEQNTHAPGWYPVPGHVNTLQFFDGSKGVEGTIPAPGQDALEQIAADVRVIKNVAVLWAALTVLGIVATIVVLANN